jgi:hypothetical protein
LSGAAILKRTRFIRPGLIIASILLAGCTTHFLRNAMVDIGLDLDAPSTSNPIIGSLSADSTFQTIVEMEAIRPEFSPHAYEFEVELPKGAAEMEMLMESTPDSVRFEPETGWMSKSGYMIYVGSTFPAYAHIRGNHFGPILKIGFSRDARSGKVVLRGKGFEEHLNLYAAESVKVNAPDRFRVEIPAGKRGYRYHARLPRRLLKNAAFQIAGETASRIERLWVNTFVPRVFYAEDAPDRRPFGRVRERWTPTRDTKTGHVPVPKPGYLFAGGWLSFLFVFILCYPTLLACASLWTWLWGEMKFAPIDNEELPSALLPFHRSEFFAYGMLFFCFWLYFLLNFWPGSMNIDSHQQWEQAQTFQFHTQHPPFYALIFWALTRLWNSPAAVALLHIVCASGVFAWGFSLMRRAGVSRLVLAGCMGLSLLSPKNAAMIISLLKDTPYAICMLALTVALFHLILEPKERARWRLWCLVGLCLGLLPLFRHNGLLVLVAIPSLCAAFFPGFRRRALLAGGGGLLLWLLIAKGLFSVLPLEKEPSVGPRLLLAHEAVLIDRDVPLSNDEYKFLASIRRLDDRWAYSKFRIDGTVEPISFEWDPKKLLDHTQAYTRHYINVMKRNPLLAAKYFFERGEYLYIPWRASHMETYILGIDLNKNRLYNIQYFLDSPKFFTELLLSSARPGFDTLFWRPALSLFACILATLLLLFRQRRALYLLPFSLVAINTFSLFITAIAQNARYQFPLTLAASLLIGMALLPAQAGRTTQNLE